MKIKMRMGNDKMRASETIFELNGYEFVLELDAGGNPDYLYTCWVYKDGKELLDSNRRQIRKEFKTKNFNTQHCINFCKKFVKDDEYRNKFINGLTP